MSDLEQPIRATPVAHQCVCNLLRPTFTLVNGEPIQGEPERDKCGRMIYDPDSPFCSDCENADHHLLPHQQGRVVRRS